MANAYRLEAESQAAIAEVFKRHCPPSNKEKAARQTKFGRTVWRFLNYVIGLEKDPEILALISSI